MPKHRNLKRLYREIFVNPWLTLLFGSEAIKMYVVAGYELTPLVTQFSLLTILSAVIWILSDTVSVDASKEKIIGDGGRLE